MLGRKQWYVAASTELRFLLRRRMGGRVHRRCATSAPCCSVPGGRLPPEWRDGGGALHAWPPPDRHVRRSIVGAFCETRGGGYSFLVSGKDIGRLDLFGGLFAFNVPVSKGVGRWGSWVGVVAMLQVYFDRGDFSLFRSEKALVRAMDYLTAFAERLNFSAQDWRKVEACIASCAPVLCDDAAVSHLVDASVLKEVVGLDDDRGVGASGSSTVVKRCPQRHDDDYRDGGASGSSGLVIASGGAFLRPRQPQRPPPTHKAMPQRRNLPPPPPPSGSRGVKRKMEAPPSNGILGWCPQCRRPRSECFQPGHWACAHCGQHNFADKTQTCSNRKCELPRCELDLYLAPEEPPKPKAYSPWCESCGTWKSICFKNNDWECPWCGNHNYARKQATHVKRECPNVVFV